MLYPKVLASIESAQALPIQQDRFPVLDQLIDYSRGQIASSKALQLNFICTHNSRRSQFSQIWAQVAAAYYDIPAHCFSGGVETTAFNERAVASIKRSGFDVDSNNTENPIYQVSFSDSHPAIQAFSKKYDDHTSPTSGFAAIMTCSDADDNCPFIPGADARIPLRYEDPKAFDDTDKESTMYDARSMQIASELFYVFGRLS